ncbi:peptidoglycan recognition protein family protein [Micromonospora sp. NBC_01813]|uniref:peptidoglycan recognition protein family protein n=1 Tax=Micromonospora sp. NBC_01813 TaxID=2975988 RepID=UPI002DD86DE0|nr:N-acetylmuramoyl-L-alanine amidase [Micromonospora sp. NBC_01813]WSA06658.1 N-acetylmuramoyl-L-alanine amidase [Micromonospora sp. NBC_01813]
MVTRRKLILGTTAAAVTVPLAGGLGFAGLSTAAAQETNSVPTTLANRRSRLESGSRVAEGSFPLTHLALTSAGAAAAVRLRTRSGWGDWRELHACDAGHDDDRRRSTFVAAAGAVGYEIQVAGGGSVDALELNTVDGPGRTVAAAESELPSTGALATESGARGLPKPRYLSRAAWGADESYRLDQAGNLVWPSEFIPVQTLTVHHTGFEDGESDPAATVRAIYYAQAVGSGWGDIGYHLLIDDQGRVYEGRYSDPDPVPVFGPQRLPDGRPQMVNAAHVGGFNAGNLGVCLIGDFTSRQPTQAAVRALTAVLAKLSAACRLDPTGTTTYVNPFNAYEATLATIPGHRDWYFANPLAGPTECPGNDFYPRLATIRQEVADLLKRG